MYEISMASPGLVAVCASWLVSGAALARGALRLRAGVEVAALALPLGLAAHVLVLNLLAHALPTRLAVQTTVGFALLAATAWWLGAGRHRPLAWQGAAGARAALAAVALAAFAGSLAWGLAEVFPDDGPHASMTQLLAAGLFPLRFPCNPDVRLAYHYGSDLLAAEALVVGRASVWTALDVVRAAAAAGAVGLAFLAGWRVHRSPRAGVLSALLLVLAGQATFMAAPLLHEPLTGWAAGRPWLARVVDKLTTLVGTTPYGVFAPAKTSMFAHAHRSLAWGFGALQILLCLALLEARVGRARKTVALGLALGATALLQVGALLILAPGLAVHWAWARFRRHGGAGSQPPTLGFSAPAAAAIGLALAVAQGGPLTDALLERSGGPAREVLTFEAAPLQLPGLRGEALTPGHLIWSLLGAGLTPFLFPWIAWRAWRDERPARLLLLAGCAVAGAFQLFVRYPYSDGAVVRALTFGLWTAAVMLGPLLEQALRAAGRRQLAAAAALVALLTSGTGFVVLYPLVPVAQPALRRSPRLFEVGALDEALRPLATRLPDDALVFDPSGCLHAFAARPAMVFGRYSASAVERNMTPAPLPAFVAVRSDPRPEWLRGHGYTHVYADDAWLVDPAVGARLTGGAFDLVGCAADGAQLRALLRICAREEGCALRLSLSECRPPASRVPWRPAPP